MGQKLRKIRYNFGENHLKISQILPPIASKQQFSLKSSVIVDQGNKTKEINSQGFPTTHHKLG